MFDFLTRLHRYLTMQDYRDAQTAIADGIVAQYSRGNGSLQNGWMIDEAAQRKLSEQADVSMRYLERCARKH